jgi:hypothetical protein
MIRDQLIDAIKRNPKTKNGRDLESKAGGLALQTTEIGAGQAGCNPNYVLPACHIFAFAQMISSFVSSHVLVLLYSSFLIHSR